jgi:hypothetical protein
VFSEEARNAKIYTIANVRRQKKIIAPSAFYAAHRAGGLPVFPCGGELANALTYRRSLPHVDALSDAGFADILNALAAQGFERV